MPETPPRPGTCLEPEVLAAYVERGLPPAERAEVEAHLARCADCHALMVELVRTIDDLDRDADAAGAPPAGGAGRAAPARVLPIGSRRAWVAGAGAAAALAASVLLVVQVRPAWLGFAEPDARVATLVDAVGGRRYTQARLAGGFEYGPLTTSARSGAGSAGDNVALLAAAAALQREVEHNPTQENLHAWGVALLLLGRPVDAAAALEDAAGHGVRLDLLVDLSAAYIERAGATDRQDDLTRALARAEQALALDAARPEAWFNKAVALELLFLTPQAIAAWEAYLRHDPSSPWSAEARERLAALQAVPDRVEHAPPAIFGDRLLDLARLGDRAGVSALVGEDVQRTRRLLERTWLADLADEDRIRAASVVAAAFAGVTGDALPRDVYRALLRADGPAAQAAAAAFLSAVTAVEENRFDAIHARAASWLRDAAPVEPLALWVQYARFHAWSQRGDLAQAVDGLRSLERVARSRGYLALAATSLNRHGQALGRMGRQQDAVATRLAAIDLFARVGELDQVASMEAMISEAYRFSGDLPRAFVHHYRSLRLLGDVRTFRTRHQVLSQTGMWAVEAGLPEAAQAFFAALRDNAVAWPSDSGLAFAEIKLADVRHRLRAADDAQGHLEAARVATARIDDAGFRERNALELLEVEAAIGDPAAGLERIAVALGRFAATGYDLRVPRLGLLRARLLARQGRPDEALQALARGLAQLGDSRTNLTEPSLRLAQAALIAELESAAGALLVERGDWRGALERFDAAKAVTIREARPGDSPDASHGGWLPWVQAALPPSAAVVFLADVGTRTLCWVVTPGAAHPPQDLGDADRLADEARRLRLAAEQGDSARFDRLRRRLSSTLLATIAGQLAGSDTLIVVPTASLGGVPFAALHWPGSDRFLVEERTVAVAPSLDALARARSGSAEPPRDPRAVAVLVPADGAGAPGLARLDAVSEEAARVAALYGSSRVLAGAMAAGPEARHVLRTADVLHFAGHAVVAPGGSVQLVLGGEPAANLGTDQIVALGPVGVRTVVLAACRSVYADTDRRTLEASLSAAAPFLAIGVREVIGTLWNVQDDDAARLSVRVHERLVAGMAAVTAVAEVQREAIAAGRAATEWAVLTAVGVF